MQLGHQGHAESAGRLQASHQLYEAVGRLAGTRSADSEMKDTIHLSLSVSNS